MLEFDKIVVCSTPNASGGPELLHQLAHELSNLGLDASIAYYPFNQHHTCPISYDKYGIKQTSFVDRAGTIFIIPETATWITKHIRLGTAAIWWLSVDNYFFAKRQSMLSDLYRRARSLIRTRVPIWKMKALTHLTQSEHAAIFLRRHGITPSMLSDCLGSEHVETKDRNDTKENLIAYNPAKGLRESTALIKRYTSFKFTAIQGMSTDEVRNLLERAKIYMDFGNHPGKDRLPREAAMAGCCVITGRKGSAANSMDVPIKIRYKLDDTCDCYIREFGPLVADIFDDYENHHADFDDYREAIKGEQDVFREQVRQLFMDNQKT